jgi:UDP-N-acetylmuramoyl-L-alanyl-D-glutamate--2,6-diaminopimelate ligase
MTAPMPLGTLLAGHASAAAFADVDVTGLSLDSRTLAVGDAFVALRGLRAHGVEFAQRAFDAGASVVLAESDAQCVDPGVSGPLVWIDDLRAKLGAIAARFYGDASRSLRIVGVTGTNGKTSTVQMLAQALGLLGNRAATIGTLGTGLVGALNAGERTTPDVISLQRLLAGFLAEGASDVAMEVSSHALEQGRVDAVRFALAIFTNLTRDHLDYHGSMEAYAAAKQQLFRTPGLAAAVINLDDACGRQIAAQLPAGVQCIGYALDRDDADVRAVDVQAHALGLRFRLSTPWGEARIESRLLGRFNVANLLAVAASLGAMGFDFGRIAEVLCALDPVAGRMSRLGGGGGLPLVVVDYAHTPDALEQALSSLRAHCTGMLVCVFGCGGERDAGKRPQMAAVTERLADRIIVTDDNPRSEEGDAIVAAILSGFAKAHAVRVERDRGKAIRSAILGARSDDIVLIAGKGHEPYQEIHGVRHPFDDRLVAAQALEARPC